MATIEDVAREAKVSVATVSRVLNSPDVVRKGTAERVRKAIEKLSYVPNSSARNLRRRESRVILMLAPNFTNPYYSQILSGICDVARDTGYTTLVYNTYDVMTFNEDNVRDLIETNHVDGTIILACNYDDIWIDKLKDKYPLVLCSEYPCDTKLTHISVDNYSAAKETVKYLIGLGHTKIGFVGSENKYCSTKYRYEGFFDGLKEAGLELPKEYVERGSIDYSFGSGKAAAEKLLTIKERPTAICCVSDVVALGVIARARELKIKVPKDLSVTGFDDVDYTMMFSPTLTTVHVPCYELGREAMRLLGEGIHNKEIIQDNAFLPYEFMIRESCDALK